MTIAADDIYVLEADTDTTTIRVAGTPGYTTTAGSTPASTAIACRIAPQAVILARSAYPDRTTSGLSDPAAGSANLLNFDKALDYLRSSRVDGRNVRMYRGQAANNFPAGWTKVLDCTQNMPSWTLDAFRLNLIDSRKYASVAINPDLYLGTNVPPAGLEGLPSDLKGKNKPLPFGSRRNVFATLVNGPKLIYQVSNIAAGTAAVYDEGVAIQSGVATWTAITSGFGATTIRGISVSPTITAAVGDAGKLFTSPDGVTWTSRTSSFGATNINGVTFGGGRFLAVGDAGKMATSPDGITWTQVASTGFGATNIRAAGYGNALYVTVGDAGKVYTSPDCITWTARTSGFGASNIFAVAYGAGLWVIAGQITKVSTSSDGTTWTLNASAAASLGNIYRGLAYGPAGFIAVGDQSTLFTSPTGAVWTRVFENTSAPSPFEAADLLSIVFGGNKYLVTTSNGRVGYSADGRSWTVGADKDLTHTDYASAYGGGLFVVAGLSGLMRLSSQSFTYATVADLQDEALKPPPGTYGYISTSTGSYFRLGEPPAGDITADILHGATAADRTMGQLLAQFAFPRAGLIAGDWSAADITAIDTANSAVLGGDITPDDGAVLCMETAEKIARSGGLWLTPDAAGVIRIKRLVPPSVNLFGQGDDLNTVPWAASGGTVTATNAYARYIGRNFSRISNANTGSWGRSLTLVAGGTYRLRGFIRIDAAVTGTLQLLILDSTAGANVADITCTIAAGGAITGVTTVGGTIIGLIRIAGPDNVYSFCLEATGIPAGHVCFVYAGSGTATSFLLSGLEPIAGAPVATIDQNVMRDPPLTPLDSGDDNEGIPPYRVVVRYGQNSHVMTNATLAGSVTDAERVRLSTEWMTAVAEDLTVLTAHPLSKPLQIDTLLTTEADAQAEANRLLALLSPSAADRAWYSFGVEATTATIAIEIGDVVDLIHERFGLGVGARAVVMGIAPKVDEANLTILEYTVWR